LPNHVHRGISEGKQDMLDSAIEDDSNDMSADEAHAQQSARGRRASDGQPLIKEGKKSNRVEVRCEQCGKGYKHSSCLTKHLLVSLLADRPPTPTSEYPGAQRGRCGRSHVFALLHHRLRLV
jgi:hypothetical protein